MKACVIMYNKMNLSSFARIYEFLHKIQIRTFSLALRAEILDEFGLKITPQIIGESLDKYDIVAIPSGFGALDLIYDDIFLAWIKTAFNAKIKITDDMGALIFGACAMLKNKSVCIRAGYINALKQYCDALDMDDYLDADTFSFREFNQNTALKLENLLSAFCEFQKD